MKSQVPNRLRELRLEHDLTNYDVASLIRRDVSMVYRYEVGLTPVPMYAARILCARYGVSAEFLLGWDRARDGDEAVA